MTISRTGTEPISDAEWEEDGWEKVGGAWKCWKCLGKPAPENYLAAVRRAELIELDQEPAKEDALDLIKRLNGPGGYGAP